MKNIVEIKSISTLHKMLGCPPPLHPHISFIRFKEMNVPKELDFESAIVNFYVISLKTTRGSMQYGRKYYDFEEGTMTFTEPNQLMFPTQLAEDINDINGWSLFIQPDLLYGTDLGNKINSYTFFSYEVDEALHLSEHEKDKVLESTRNIQEEYSQNIDQHSQELIVSNLELLLNYCKRFYDRQFLTRTKQNKGVVIQIEKILKTYFDSNKPSELGLPNVKYCAEQLSLSPNYLSDLLKRETGKNTKEHIDYYLIQKAKTLLHNTDLNINEIAYDLGFEYAKSFGKLFKKKEGITPTEYREGVSH